MKKNQTIKVPDVQGQQQVRQLYKKGSAFVLHLVPNSNISEGMRVMKNSYAMYHRSLNFINSIQGESLFLKAAIAADKLRSDS